MYGDKAFAEDRRDGWIRPTEYDGARALALKYRLYLSPVDVAQLVLLLREVLREGSFD